MKKLPLSVVVYCAIASYFNSSINTSTKIISKFVVETKKLESQKNIK